MHRICRFFVGTQETAKKAKKKEKEDARGDDGDDGVAVHAMQRTVNEAFHYDNQKVVNNYFERSFVSAFHLAATTITFHNVTNPELLTLEDCNNAIATTIITDSEREDRVEDKDDKKTKGREGRESESEGVREELRTRIS